MAKQRGKPLRVAVLDASGALRASRREGARRAAHRRASRASSSSPPGEGPLEACARRSRPRSSAGRIDGYLYLPPDALARSAAEYYGKNVSNVMDLGLLDKAVEDALVGFRLSGAGLPEARSRS